MKPRSPAREAGGPARPAGVAIPKRRRRVYRLVVALLVPLAFLIVAEAGLRVAGYGYPTDFFLTRSHAGRSVLVENQQFGCRFFPAHLARTPQPLMLETPKASGSCRVFLFGESAAMGDPDPDFGPARALQALLRDRFPGKTIEVANVAMTAINSHAAREIARDCASREGDIWIVYMGNNEVIGPYGAGTIFGPKTPPLWVIRLNLAVGKTRLGQWLQSVARSMKNRDAMPASWGGLRMFQDNQIRSDDSRLERVRSHYRDNLESIIRLGTEAGARVLVCTVATNLRECAPFGSLHRPGLTAVQLGAWETAYGQGVAHQGAGRCEDAVRSYGEAAAIDPSFAALQFRLGRALLALGRPKEAREAFRRARDEDTLRFRTDDALNEIIRTAAKQMGTAATRFVDVEAAMNEMSPDHIPGLNFFWEHVHFNFAGVYAFARAVAEPVSEMMPPGFVRDPAARPWLSEMECAKRLAYTRWNEQKILGEIYRRHQGPPCTMQLDHEERAEAWRQRLAGNAATGNRGALMAAVEAVRAGVPGPDFDWVIHKNVAQMLEAAGELPAALKEWEMVAGLAPQYANARYHLGNVLDQMGQSGPAEAEFRRAIGLQPNMAEAFSGLGLALAAQGRVDEAMTAYARAVEVNPDSIHAYINWGLALASRGEHAEAIEKYERALKLDPGAANAFHNLGLSLAALGRSDAAVRAFTRALEISPQLLPARLGLGREWLKMRNPTRAVAVLESGLPAAGNSAQLHLQLGLAREQMGQADIAAREIEEALRLSPGLPEAQAALSRLKGTR